MLIGGTLEKSRISPSTDEEMLMQLLGKLYEKVNLDFREYKIPSIKRRIDRRLRATRSDSYEAYSNFLDLNPDEYEQLLDDLTINVTEFFRDDEPWQILRDRVFPDIVSDRKASDNAGKPIRIWSAGCATGQEAYSAAILFHELIDEHSTPLNLKIYATDIDEDCLSAAPNGVFRSESLAGIDSNIIDTYFEPDEYYRIKPSIRKHICFEQHDLVLDKPLPDMDCIICRNVTIYFSRELQDKLYANFYQSLREGGYLFLGKAESLFGDIAKKFTPISKKWKIYQKQYNTEK